MKDYLGYENNDRNKRHADTFARLMHLALGQTTQVFIGHHLSFQLNGDLATENEIPSADCLMFDHDIMGKVFGAKALAVMLRLAALPCDQRDDTLKVELDALA